MREVRINGVIGMDVTLESVQSQLQNLQPTEDILFNISSPGGSVLTGFEIYNEIKMLPTSGKKIFQINGLAASIASIIVMAGDEIEASELSLFMIHKASSGIEGNASQLQEQIEVLNMIDKMLMDTYSARNAKNGKKKLSEKEMVAMLEAETWMTPQEAMDYGFIDRVINQVSDVTKIAAQTTQTMKHLDKLRRLLANSGKIEFTIEDVKAAVAQALSGKTYSSMTTDEDINAFLVAVKSILSNKAGGTLTDEDTAKVNELLNQAVTELQEIEAANTTAGQISQLAKAVAEIKGMLDTMSKAAVESGQQVENLTEEITNLKKGVRSFGKKPFVNEGSKLNLGSAYADPYAKHREEMKKIDDQTRKKK
jgi:ATP-dependent protease ClpP protease subunit